MASNTFKTDSFISYELAEWCCGLTFEDLSSEVIQSAKLFWYDSLGCALGGTRQKDAKILRQQHEAMAAASGATGGSCTLFGGGRANPVDAAFLNSHMVRAMDFNDIYWKADPCHPSDMICGPLAICEHLGLSGRDLLLGTAIAYEVEMRLCEVGRPGVREYGWHHATLTAFASPFAPARLLGLSVDEMVQSIGISASRGCSLGAVTAGKLTNMKNTVDPWATRLGVESALLAQLGYSGPEHIFDGKEGLFHVFGHSMCHGEQCGFDAEELVKDLPRSSGDRFRINECGMKSFPIEALSHAPLSAMMKIIKAHDVAPADVREITVEVIARAADILGDPAKYRPTGKETADHSLPYSLAVGLMDGKVTPLQFKQERIDDPALIPVMDMVKVVANEEFEARFPEYQPSRVTLTLADGSTHTDQVDVPKGDPRDPMTEAEISVKFDALSTEIVGSEACGRIRDLVMGLDTADSVTPLMEVMSTTVG